MQAHSDVALCMQASLYYPAEIIRYTIFQIPVLQACLYMPLTRYNAKLHVSLIVIFGYESGECTLLYFKSVGRDSVYSFCVPANPCST